MEPAARPRRRRQASISAGRAKNEPSAIAASIRGRSCSTGRPAPRFRWPTSGLPICPGGRPTASSDARSSAWGQRASSPRHTAIGAAAIASAARSRPTPKPSSTTRTMGRGRGRSVTRRESRRGAFAVSAAQATMPAISSGLVSTADERAVDRQFGKELADVRRCDAAAIEDREGISRSPQPGVRSTPRMALAIADASAPLAFGPSRSPRLARTQSPGPPSRAVLGRGRGLPGSWSTTNASAAPVTPWISRTSSGSPMRRIGRSPPSTDRPSFGDPRVGLGMMAALAVADDDPRREPLEHRGRYVLGVALRRPARGGRPERRRRRPFPRVPSRRPPGRATAGGSRARRTARRSARRSGQARRHRRASCSSSSWRR